MHRSLILCLLVLTALGASSLRASSIQVFSSRDAWFAAVANAGIHNIGTESFQAFTVGVYSGIFDSGGASFQTTLAVQLLNDNFKKVLRSGPGGVQIVFSFPVQALGLDVVGTESVGFGSGAHVVSLSGVSVSVPVSGFVGLLGSPGELSEVDVAADNPFSAGIMLLKNVSYPGGPLSSPTNPIFPVSQCGPSCYNFVSPITPEWYDPPLAGAYTFISQNGKFTSINAFPTGFSGSFLVSTRTGNLGSFGSAGACSSPAGPANSQCRESVRGLMEPIQLLFRSTCRSIPPAPLSACGQSAIHRSQAHG